MTITAEDTQAFCSRCFGPMQVLYDDETKERYFDCPNCGKVVIPKPGRPRMKNIAESYAVKLGLKE